MPGDFVKAMEADRDAAIKAVMARIERKAGPGTTLPAAPDAGTIRAAVLKAAFDAAEDPLPVQEGLNGLKNTAFNQMEEKRQTTEAGAANKAEAVKNANGSPESTKKFEEEMRTEEKEVAQNCTEKIHSYYKEAIELGQKYPNQQANIKATTRGISKTIEEAVSAIGSALTKIVAKIVEFLEAIISWIKENFAPVVEVIGAILAL